MKIKKLSRSTYIIIAVIGCVILGIFLCRFINRWFAPVEEISLGVYGYKIDPDTILSFLYDDDLNVLLYEDDTMPVYDPEDYIPVKWQVSDYLLIANALHRSAWGESLESWQISRVDFEWDCQYMSTGAQELWIDYYKIIKTDEKDARLESNIKIQPRRIAVSIEKFKYYPNYWTMSGINLDELPISMTEAVEIAEKNGGKIVRESADNNCYVLVLMNIERYDGWRVFYKMEDVSKNKNLYFYIDSKNGDVEKIVE